MRLMGIKKKWSGEPEKEIRAEVKLLRTRTHNQFFSTFASYTRG